MGIYAPLLEGGAIMGNLGGLLGFLTGLLVFLALMNYVVKWVNRQWVAKLPKTSKFKAAYTPVMRFLVKNHRFFGLGAALTVAIHLILQITFRWLSLTGLIASIALALDVMIGAWLYFKQKGKRGPLFMVHRAMGVVLIIAIAAHMLSKM